MHRFRHRSVLFVLTTLTCCMPLRAQANAQSFETAAIHPSKASPGCFSMLPPGGIQFEVTCIPLRALIGLAYMPDELEGPDTALDTMYDVRATMPSATSWSTETLNAMLRALLTERFRLVFHTKAKTVHGYQLVVGPHGSSLKPSAVKPGLTGQKAGEPTHDVISNGRVQGRGLQSGAVASMLSLALHAPIDDATGLTGVYDMDLRFAPEDAVGSDLPSFHDAVKEQLGLELKPTQVSIKVMVVDHVDGEPAAN